MEDHKNHSFISNSKLRRFSLRLILFSIPVISVLFALEFALRKIDLEPKVKAEYIKNNSEDIRIAILGSSQTERAINPEYLEIPTINFSNSSQRIPENFKLLKHFEPRLPNLKLVVIEIPFDILSRDKSFTSKIVDQENLIFYNTNTFGRKIKIQDYILYPTDPSYFWTRIKNFYTGDLLVKTNKYGFDTNKFYGSYQARKNNDSLIKREDIYIVNAKNRNTLNKNEKTLNNLIEWCKNNQLEILLYSAPNHYRYNNLKDPDIINTRNQVVKKIQKRYPAIKFFNEEENKIYTTDLFYNANHLNPKGAALASKRLNDFIQQNYFRNIGTSVK